VSHNFYDSEFSTQAIGLSLYSFYNTDMNIDCLKLMLKLLAVFCYVEIQNIYIKPTFIPLRIKYMATHLNFTWIMGLAMDWVVKV